MNYYALGDFIDDLDFLEQCGDKDSDAAVKKFFFFLKLFLHADFIV